MEIKYDLNKSNKNQQDRGLPFDLVHNFDWATALVVEDVRKDYPERRFIAVGYLTEETRLLVLCFTPIKNGIRVISFRKANTREVKRYEKETINQ